MSNFIWAHVFRLILSEEGKKNPSCSYNLPRTLIIIVKGNGEREDEEVGDFCSQRKV